MTDMGPFALAFLVFASVVAAAPQTPSGSIAAPPDVAAPPADASKTASGLVTKVLTRGSGKDHPTKDDVVIVQYTGWKTDGTMFDSSVGKAKPAIFGVGRVIAGFSEGLQLMVTGEKRRVWIPESLAYRGQREPKGTLVFDVELLDIPSHPPADVKAPPPDAKKTATGLAYKVLKQGVGGRHPRPTGAVTVNYTGWTTDGKMFDSSIVKGESTTFQVDQVIPGWTEGLQLMYEGEKTRFWIPESIAYQGKRAPYGMLVFDVELLKIE
jgi:peptidylprolyl isomerase